MSTPPRDYPPGLLPALQALCAEMADIGVIGSLWDPQRTCVLHGASWAQVQPYFWGLMAEVLDEARERAAREDAEDAARHGAGGESHAAP